jgi:hypothetical protein
MCQKMIFPLLIAVLVLSACGPATASQSTQTPTPTSVVISAKAELAPLPLGQEYRLVRFDGTTPPTIDSLWQGMKVVALVCFGDDAALIFEDDIPAVFIEAGLAVWILVIWVQADGPQKLTGLLVNSWNALVAWTAATSAARIEFPSSAQAAREMAERLRQWMRNKPPEFKDGDLWISVAAITAELARGLDEWATAMDGGVEATINAATRSLQTLIKMWGIEAAPILGYYGITP